MTKETAVYGVQRGETLYNCKGEELCDKIISGDIFTITHSSGTTYKYSYLEDVDTAISDSDSIACTDTDGITYKITGAEFKELLTCEAPQPTFVIHQEYFGADSTCDYKTTPVHNSSPSFGGTLRVEHYVEFTTDSTGWEVELEPLQYEKTDGSGWGDASNPYQDGRRYNFYVAYADPQDNIDSNVEPKIKTRTKWSLIRLSTGEIVDSGYQYYEFSSDEGPDGKPSFYKLEGVDFRPNSEKIIAQIKYDPNDGNSIMERNYSIYLHPVYFDYNVQGCMRNVNGVFRAFDTQKDRYEWQEWSKQSLHSHPTEPGDVRVFQAKQIVNIQYYPTFKTHYETIPIEYEVMEFAVVFGNIDYETNNNIRVVYGGKYPYPYDGPPKFFTPR